MEYDISGNYRKKLEIIGKADTSTRYVWDIYL